MNVADERKVALRALLRREHLLTEAMQEQLAVPWRTHGVFVQIVFFLLTAMALGAFHGFWSLVQFPGAGFLTAFAGIGLAELLVRRARWFWTGVESALCLGAMLALISELPSSGKPESLLVIAAAIAIAAARVRNPVLGAGAAMLVIAYFEWRFDVGVIAALVIGCAAILALLRMWQRPSTEWLFVLIALAAPVAGWIAADVRWRAMTVAIYAAWAIVALVLAVAKRHHALFFVGLIALAAASVEVSHFMPIALEAKLAIGGAALLLASAEVMRRLRGRTRGFVLTADDRSEAVAILATLAVQPQAHASAPEAQPVQGGGTFGGAGASGDY